MTVAIAEYAKWSIE